MGLVRALAKGYRVANRLLNPLAPECMHQPKKQHENSQVDHKSTRNENKDAISEESNENLRTPKNCLLKHKKSASNPAAPVCFHNPFGILGIDNEDDKEKPEVHHEK